MADPAPGTPAGPLSESVCRMSRFAGFGSMKIDVEPNKNDAGPVETARSELAPPNPLLTVIENARFAHPGLRRS